jgi:hypothetical protein
MTALVARIRLEDHDGAVLVEGLLSRFSTDFLLDVLRVLHASDPRQLRARAPAPKGRRRAPLPKSP